MTRFRPISLYNVSYKIISKILCQRLKKILSQRISKTQSAFVAERQITDNIMIAQEMFHALRNKPSGQVKEMAIKQIWVKHMIGWNGHSLGLSCGIWVFQRYGLTGLWDTSPRSSTKFSWMENQGKLLSQEKVYVKEIICLLSYLFYARKRSLAFLIMHITKGR